MIVQYLAEAILWFAVAIPRLNLEYFCNAESAMQASDSDETLVVL